MKKAQKTDMVADLSQRFSRASMALISEYKGMTAAESTELRRRLRAVRGELRVAKNTLVRRAIRDTNFAGLDSQLGGPVGLIFSFEDPIAVAKAVTSFKRGGREVQAARRRARRQTADPRGNPGTGQYATQRGGDGPAAGPLAGPGQRPGAADQRARMRLGKADRRDRQEERSVATGSAGIERSARI